MLLLSTGRPGIFLWLSGDARGAKWSPVDIVDWHNQSLDEPSHIKIPAPASTKIDPLSARKGQTTSYTAMVEVSPNRIFLVYDRAPLGCQALEKDFGQHSHDLPAGNRDRTHRSKLIHT